MDTTELLNLIKGNNQAQNQTFEDKVSGGEMSNNISSILPFLSGGMNPQALIEMLAKNNPSLKNISAILPMLQNIPINNKKKKENKKINYVKISEYYKK